MRLESICENGVRISVIWHENQGAVQPKVDHANMLIQGQFLKVWRVQNRAVFCPSEVLETMPHSPRDSLLADHIASVRRRPRATVTK
jgi:hypothetical protein